MKIENILKIVLGVMLAITVGLLIAALATGSTSVIGYNLIWAYILVAIALGSAVFCAIFGMIKAAEGLMKTLISVGVVVVVIGVSYAVAQSNLGEIKIVNLEDGSFFPEWDTMITEASVLVTYVTLGATILAAIAGQVFNTIEGLKK